MYIYIWFKIYIYIYIYIYNYIYIYILYIYGLNYLYTTISIDKRVSPIVVRSLSCESWSTWLSISSFPSWSSRILPCKNVLHWSGSLGHGQLPKHFWQTKKRNSLLHRILGHRWCRTKVGTGLSQDYTSYCQNFEKNIQVGIVACSEVTNHNTVPHLSPSANTIRTRSERCGACDFL